MKNILFFIVFLISCSSNEPIPVLKTPIKSGDTIPYKIIDSTFYTAYTANDGILMGTISKTYTQKMYNSGNYSIIGMSGENKDTYFTIKNKNYYCSVVKFTYVGKIIKLNY